MSPKRHHLQCIKGFWRYRRRWPRSVAQQASGEFFILHLNTCDMAEAIRLRPMAEAAFNQSSCRCARTDGDHSTAQVGRGPRLKRYLQLMIRGWAELAREMEAKLLGRIDYEMTDNDLIAAVRSAPAVRPARTLKDLITA